ncbi:MAG: cholesterol oxidase, partial [Bdellovibrionales bacterium]|nr:cholesterol oxidase [Bdellovibrionales bacterium]
TAHILGGAIISSSSDSGVVNTNHEVYGHPGLYVCDASVIPSNLAVNPSLTISALSERFASKFPNILKEDEVKSREINFSG